MVTAQSINKEMRVNTSVYEKFQKIILEQNKKIRQQEGKLQREEEKQRRLKQQEQEKIQRLEQPRTGENSATQAERAGETRKSARVNARKRKA